MERRNILKRSTATSSEVSVSASSSYMSLRTQQWGGRSCDACPSGLRSFTEGSECDGMVNEKGRTKCVRRGAWHTVVNRSAAVAYCAPWEHAHAGVRGECKAIKTGVGYSLACFFSKG